MMAVLLGGAIAALCIAAAVRPARTQAEIVSIETSTTLHASRERSPLGEPVTFTAKIDAAHGAVPGGEIDFFDETTARWLGRASATSPSITVSNLPAGVRRIRAEYRGTQAFMPTIVQPSVSRTIIHRVLVRPELTLAAVHSAGGTVLLTVDVGANGLKASGHVAFREGATILARDVPLDGSGRASFITSASSVEARRFVAEYSGDATFAPATAITDRVVSLGAVAAPFVIGDKDGR
ncbi:hypothetical protein X566_24395 [Afipia sp. P52-10]|jgi:hypothetical protein|uniref:Ig-like domain-containing protein n=1 Tax=Afipia sp. P52-10 TaxID=1429916 RepID=UPI0003DF042E|nr:Ig-like domain-containing protein [Afipia sp. P52-10]ETR75805.1 hypothetical protein X566_24395 [Afipia sp. P52-10]